MNNIEQVPTLANLPDVQAVTGINVKSFGAKIDGATDDTASVVAAIAAVTAAGGGIVFFPPGICRITAPSLTVAASGVHLRGAGNGVSLLFFDTADITTFGRVIFDGGATTGTISGVSCRDMTIYNRPGVSVTGPQPGYDGSACLLTFRGCQGFLCDNVETYNSPNYGIVALRSFDGNISNCHSHNHIADGMHVQDGSARITMSNNHIHDTGDDGIGVGYHGALTVDIIIVGNTIENTGSRGIALMGPAQCVTVTGNTVRNTLLSGIYGESFSGLLSDVTVSANTIYNAGNYMPAYGRGTGIGLGILFDVANSGNTISQLVITGNVIDSPRNGFIWLGDFASHAYGTLYGVIVSGNIMSNIAGTGPKGATAGGGGFSNGSANGHYPGIWIQQCGSVAVIGNTMYGSWNEAILADSGNPTTELVRIDGNTLRGCNMSALGSTYAILVSNGSVCAIGNVAVNSPNITGVISLTGTVVTNINNARI